jgi:hypothetical protein
MRGNSPNDDPEHLRRLAAWFRAFAEVGHTDYREDRLNWAEYLERRADALEQAAKGG